MAPTDDSLPSKRARNPPPAPPSAPPPPPRMKRKRVAADADEDSAAGGRKQGKDNHGAKVVPPSAQHTHTAGPGTPQPGAQPGSAQPGQPEEPKRESKLDFVAFPSEALQTYLLTANLVPVIEPSPYSDLPAPLPNTLYNPPTASSSSHVHSNSNGYPSAYGESSLSGARSRRGNRTAILADVQTAHEVFAAAAKEHWEKTGGAGSGGIREGEVVTGFLYRCRVGDRVLKVVPPS